MSIYRAAIWIDPVGLAFFIYFQHDFLQCVLCVFFRRWNFGQMDSQFSPFSFRTCFSHERTPLMIAFYYISHACEWYVNFFPSRPNDRNSKKIYTCIVQLKYFIENIIGDYFQEILLIFFNICRNTACKHICTVLKPYFWFDGSFEIFIHNSCLL